MSISYKPRVHYTPEQLQQAIIDDLKIDAEQAEAQAATGRPDAPALAAYAAKCRADIAVLEAQARPQLNRYGWPVALSPQGMEAQS
jgi:hypothetical protein